MDKDAPIPGALAKRLRSCLKEYKSLKEQGGRNH